MYKVVCVLPEHQPVMQQKVVNLDLMILNDVQKSVEFCFNNFNLFTYKKNFDSTFNQRNTK